MVDILYGSMNVNALKEELRKKGAKLSRLKEQLIQSLVQAIALINRLPKDIFMNILNHVVAQLKNGKPSSEDQLDKLKTTCNLKEEDLMLVLQSLAYILKQASKVILKPTVLRSQLCEICQMKSEKAEELVKVWTEDTKATCPLENRMKLESIAWDLNFETASSVCYKETIPNARLQLNLAKVDGSETDNVILSLNEEELTSLYRSMENIQVKLDTIQNALKS